MDQKGIVMDDTSYIDCPDQLLGGWPNTKQKVTAIRTNAPWRSFWDQAKRDISMSNLVKFVKANNAKVLVGQDATCNETDDDLQWKQNLQFIKQLGEEHVLGVAIGNEMDILWQHSAWWRKPFPNCMIDLWDRGGYVKAFQRRVSEMDAALGTHTIPVTSVWTAGFSHSGNPLMPFTEWPGRAMVRSFVQEVYGAYGKRWVWTFNPYPIWSRGLQPDTDNPAQCNDAIAATKGPIAQDMIAAVRKAIKVLTKQDDDPIWAGEYGWSSPISQGMAGIRIFDCKNYTSLQTFAGYYEHFLKWDLTLSEATDPEDRKLKGLDRAFFFTMRDASNGGAREYFGLVGKCGDTKCKIANPIRETGVVAI
jgi:hypothetical protein